MRLLPVVLALAPPLLAQCEPAAAVMEILEEAAGQTAGLPYRQGRQTELAILRKGLGQHPQDYFLLRRLLRAMDEAEALEWARTLRERHPDEPVHALIHAEALEGRNTGEALQILDSIFARHPGLSRAHLVAARIRRTPTFRDEALAARHSAAFFDACPAPLEPVALRALASAGPKERMAAVAGNVRRRIAEAPQRLMADVYEALWNLEFRAAPPSDHPALRRRILDDLSRLEPAGRRDSLRWLAFLQRGYQLAASRGRAEEISNEILQKFPKSEIGKSILRERWHAAHPFPAGKGEKAAEAWAREAARQYEQWRRLWPEDSLLCYEWFGALVRIPETPAELIGRIGEELVELYHRAPDWHGSPPLEFRVAEAFLQRGVRLERVPELLDEGVALAEKRDREQLARDVLPEDFRKIVAEGMEERRIERARLLLEWCAKTGRRGRAAAVDAELAAMQPSSARLKSRLLETRGLAAETEGRRLDALFFYRAALGASGHSQARADLLRGRMQRLWRELGGTDAASALLLDKPGPVEASTLRWQEPPARPLPPFRLTDLQGNVWTLDALKGKVALIHVWASWCGPCRAEHPEFQKLYDELKTRTDVAVLSFNVDEQAGQAAPYMEKNRYSFPVLLAREVVDQVLDTVAIPQNWFLNREGRIVAVQIGYSGEPGWREQILARLGEIAAAK